MLFKVYHELDPHKLDNLFVISIVIYQVIYSLVQIFNDFKNALSRVKM